MSNRSHLSNSDHIGDLLPAYVNGTLDQERWERVHTHLGSCDACRDELVEWESIASATRTFAASLGAAAHRDQVNHALAQGLSIGTSGANRAIPEQRTGGRPVSNRTLRSAQEKKDMQTVPSVPVRGTTRYEVPRRYAAFAVVIAILLGISGIALMNGPDGGDDTVRLPVAMQVSPETSAVAQCEPSVDALERVSATGETAHEALIQLPPGPYEAVPGIESSMLPEGGEPADPGTVEEITRSLEAIVSCINDEDSEGVIAWTSDDYWKRRDTVGIETDVERPRTFVSFVSPTGDETVLPTIENARVYPDGRVGAIIRPGFDAPSYMYDYFVFVQQDGRWLIDEAVHVTEWITVDVIVTDEGFAPQEIVAPAAPAKLVLRNDGTTTHSIVIPDLLIRIEVAPGESGMENLKHPGGRFDFHSDISGDDPAIFSGSIVIGEAPQATPEAPADPAESPSLDALGVPVASTTIMLLPPMEYEPNRVAILANHDVEMTLVNDPSLSTGVPDYLTPVSDEAHAGSPANFTIDALGISVDLEPGETRTITVNAPAGVYAYYSTIPGHTEVGMSGTLHVFEEATPAP